MSGTIDVDEDDDDEDVDDEDVDDDASIISESVTPLFSFITLSASGRCISGLSGCLGFLAILNFFHASNNLV